jgi:hypothetical protein
MMQMKGNLISFHSCIKLITKSLSNPYNLSIIDHKIP